MKCRCLLPDMYSTLVDSRADLITSVNLMLDELGCARLADESVVKFAGEGARLLVERAAHHRRAGTGRCRDRSCAGVLPAPLPRASARPEARLSRVEEKLAYFRHLPKAVFTNKPYDSTLALLEGLGLLAHFAVILGGDSLPQREPSPEPLLQAAQHCGCAIGACLVGKPL